MGTLQALFDEHAGIALSRQRDLGARIGDWSWQFDMDAGTMTFEKAGFLGFGKKRITSACQVLGSESESSATWLWSWANTQSGLPPALLRAAEKLRGIGERGSIRELTERSLPLERWDGHQLAMIAAGLTDAPGYYRGPYDGGALFVLLLEPTLRTEVPQPLVRFSTVLPELLGGFEVHDHRLAARGLARGLGLSVSPSGSGDEGLDVSDGASRVALAFDARGRMTELSGAFGRPVT